MLRPLPCALMICTLGRVLVVPVVLLQGRVVMTVLLRQELVAAAVNRMGLDIKSNYKPLLSKHIVTR
jgi:hypothetical protein